MKGCRPSSSTPCRFANVLSTKHRVKKNTATVESQNTNLIARANSSKHFGCKGTNKNRQYLYSIFFYRLKINFTRIPPSGLPWPAPGRMVVEHRKPLLTGEYDKQLLTNSSHLLINVKKCILLLCVPFLFVPHVIFMNHIYERLNAAVCYIHFLVSFFMGIIQGRIAGSFDSLFYIFRN